MTHLTQRAHAATAASIALALTAVDPSSVQAANATAGLTLAEQHVTQTRYRTAEVEGLTVFYREAGAPEHPAIVLLHGFPSSSYMFRELIPLLGDRFRVIAPDYIGFGYSDAPPVERFAYTFDNLARMVEGLLDRLGVSRYVLYLHDYGGPVGFRLAAKHPERVAGLIIQNANAYVEGFSTEAANTVKPFWEHRTPETEAVIRKLFSLDGIRYQYVAGAGDPEALTPDTWTLDHALVQRPGNDAIQVALFADYKHNLERYAAWHAYFRRYHPKTLIVWGRNDPIFIVPGAEAYRRDLPDAEFIWLDGGHFALEEHAAEVARQIKRVFADGRAE
jgi:pimeloyl-ACP methyl ester carboxylesterase